MIMKLFDSELKVMEALWNEGELPARELAIILKEQTGWNRNTTYTIVKRMIEKGAVERLEPNFVCRPLIAKEQVQQQEATELVGKLFDGSAGAFLSAFLNGKKLSQEEIDQLRQLVKSLK